MRVFNLISLALFAFGSFADHNLNKKKDETSSSKGKRWVVLVAGSKRWANYRHQANVCHAYQIIRGNGIPEENIITMMVDDIAYNKKNPTPGMIINWPNGTNVYKGVVIDYRGKDVNSDNFLNIITGNKTAMRSIGSGKVIQGGSNDNIFIYYADHGATGILGFPSDFLYADQLNNALEYMYEHSTYAKMLIYIEACEAGSMFDGILNENTNILAITASGPRENSYACYCDYLSLPYYTCLGDDFSTTWMEELEMMSFKQAFTKIRTTLNDFLVVRTYVILSNVMAYGDFNTGFEKLSDFIGYAQPYHIQTSKMIPKSTFNKEKMTVSSRHVHEHSINYELADNKISLDEQRMSMGKLRNNKMRSIINSVFQGIYSMVVNTRPDIENQIGKYNESRNLVITLDMFPCYRNILNKITETCFSLPENPYSLDQLTSFAKLCAVDKYIHQTVSNAVVKVCSNIPKKIKYVY